MNTRPKPPTNPPSANASGEPLCAPDGGPDSQVTIYDASSDLARPGRLLWRIGSDFWAGRELAWRLFIRNLRGLYRQTLLGLLWIFLPPVANTAIWVFLKSRNVFSFGGEVQTSETVYILAGMILWQSFIEAFQMPMNSISQNRNMISKLNFPRESLVLEGIADLVFNFLVRGLILLPAFLIFGVAIQPLALLSALPLAILLLVLAVGMGLILAPFGSLYQDVGRFIGMVAPFWMILTPIIYVAPTTFPGNLLNWLNPASPLLVATRDLVVTGTTGQIWPALVYGIATVPVFLLGLVVWRVSMPAVVERMPA